MRVVCDTNVLIAGMVADGLCRDIVKRRLPLVELITSRPLLDELTKTLRKKFGVHPDDVPLLHVYRDRAKLVRPAPLPTPVCRDANDDMVLATALAAQADLILTGDEGTEIAWDSVSSLHAEAHPTQMPAKHPCRQAAAQAASSNRRYQAF